MKVNEVKRVAVIGAGTMGYGIAMELALAGYDVGLHDIAEERVQAALNRIQAGLRMMAAAGLISHERVEPAYSRIRGGTQLDAVVSGSEVVIESAVESLPVKQDIFRELDRLCPPDTILASNTSSFMPSQLAAATARPEMVLVAHHFNPPHLLPGVEVVRSERTSDEAVTTTCELLKRAGKRPVVIKEIPGFIAVRLQAALLREAASLVSHGFASPQDVDTLVRNSFGRRLAVAGPFEVSDMAGWDIIVTAFSRLYPELDRSTEMSPFLKQKVEEGDLGQKTGRGFYDWTTEAGEAKKQRITDVLIKLAQDPYAD
jgi:3-hydroxybutyryl-CoA dehydrogenase